MTDTLEALARRVEALTGPSREVDGWIHAHMTRGERYVIGNEPGRFPQKPIYGERLDVMKSLTKDPVGAAQYIGAPSYTASLDAAMSLVPEGWRCGFEMGGRHDSRDVPDAWCWPWESDFEPDWQMGHEGYRSASDATRACAATPSLALCAAALRAHLAKEKGSEG